MRSFQTVIRLLLTISASVALGYGLSGLSKQAISGAGDGPSQAAAATLPKDVHADSRNRLPLVRREDLDEAGKKLYDQSTSASSPVGLQGPGGIRLHSPRLAEYSRRELNYLENESGLDHRLTQLAILVTARQLDQQFEWAAHERMALKAGLSQETIDIVKYRKPLTGVQPEEAAIIQLGREVFGQKKVNSDTFAKALKLFGKAGLVNLVYLMGRYAGTAVLLTAFDQQLAVGQKPLLPIP